jgi:hypothetical protein
LVEWLRGAARASSAALGVLVFGALRAWQIERDPTHSPASGSSS